MPKVIFTAGELFDKGIWIQAVEMLGLDTSPMPKNTKLSFTLEQAAKLQLIPDIEDLIDSHVAAYCQEENVDANSDHAMYLRQEITAMVYQEFKIKD